MHAHAPRGVPDLAAFQESGSAAPVAVPEVDPVTSLPVGIPQVVPTAMSAGDLGETLTSSPSGPPSGFMARPMDAEQTHSPVSDDVRNRYGLLLDSAAERGLLDAVEYQHRLGLLADATSEEELRILVTEFPAFGGAPSSADRATGVDPELALLGLTSLTPLAAKRRVQGTSPKKLVALVLIMVATLVVSILVLATTAHHLRHQTPAVPAGSGSVASSGIPNTDEIAPLSGLRL